MLSTKKPFVRYVVMPLASATAAAAGMAIIMVLHDITGHRGQNQTADAPVPFLRAWTDVPLMAGLLFVVTYVVLSVWVMVRWRE